MADALSPLGGEVRRFVLEAAPVRGFCVRLERAWQELTAGRGYAPPVEALLGEAVTAAVLLAATLKFQGALTLQLQGDGRVPLLVAQCTHRFEVRGVARPAAPVPDEAPFRLLAGHGRLTVTIEAEERAMRYQGIVALDGDCLADCVTAYFTGSEQLPTRLALSSGPVRTAGVLLQQIPAGGASGRESGAVWRQLQPRLAGIDASLLQLGSPEEVLRALCGPLDCRLFEPAPVRCVCRCADGRIDAILRALGREEIESILAERGAVTVTCEFCGRQHRYDPVDAARLFGAEPPLAAPASLN